VLPVSTSTCLPVFLFHWSLNLNLLSFTSGQLSLSIQYHTGTFICPSRICVLLMKCPRPREYRQISVNLLSLQHKHANLYQQNRSQAIETRPTGALPMMRSWPLLEQLVSTGNLQRQSTFPTRRQMLVVSVMSDWLNAELMRIGPRNDWTISPCSTWNSEKTYGDHWRPRLVSVGM